MATNNQHLTQYYHNRSLLKLPTFDANIAHNRDWAITIAFYCALHLVEKALADNNLHCRGHVERNKHVFSGTIFRPVAAHYQALYNQSRRARYDCVSFSKSDIDGIIAALEYIEFSLKPTENSAV